MYSNSSEHEQRRRSNSLRKNRHIQIDIFDSGNRRSLELLENYIYTLKSYDEKKQCRSIGNIDYYLREFLEFEIGKQGNYFYIIIQLNIDSAEFARYFKVILKKIWMIG